MPNATRRPCCFAGITLFLIGIFPLTPLVWLFAGARGAFFALPGGARLEFWETELLGAIIASLGVFLIYFSSRRRRKGIMI